MLLVAAVIIYHPQLSTFGETHFGRFVFEMFLDLIPQVEDDVICFRTQRVQLIHSLVCSGLQCLLLLIGLHKDVVVCGNHSDRGVVDRSSALIDALFFALNHPFTIFGQTLLGLLRDRKSVV